MTDQESFLVKETEQFRLLYLWLKESFSSEFCALVTEDELLLVAHSLVGFRLQGYYSVMNFAGSTIVLSSDAAESDCKIFEQFESRQISCMRTFVSKRPLPNESTHVRITLLTFGSSAQVAVKPLLEQAKTTDHTLCEVIRSQEDKNQFTLTLAAREAPRVGYVSSLLRVLSGYNVRLGALYVAFLEPDLLYLEAELFGATDVQDLVQELAQVRDFATQDCLDEVFTKKQYVDSQVLLFLRSVSLFCHQLLRHVDPHMYALDNVQEAFCFWPELAKNLYQLFCLKFDPYSKNLEEFSPLRQKLIELIERQDTGKEMSDLRRKTCLRYGVLFVDHVLKTNFFVTKKGAISFRLDPGVLEELKKPFPKRCFGIFYLYSRDFFGFHIRFQDLARGGMRTVMMKSKEAIQEEMPLIFSECYQLAYTQEKKNKDIPEGGAKAICFLAPQGNLYRAQRLFIESLLQLVAEVDRSVVDYYGLPEYLYLGPDENMHDAMIEWIAAYAKKIGYLPGVAFITSKPSIGINHKRYGVTSLGVNVCMVEVLRFLGINPYEEPFTVKMAGGPDGDVAGNQICNLEKHFSKTAKLITLIDVSGVIYDPKGLDLAYLKELFLQAKPIRNYPPEKLSDGGFLLDLKSEKKEAVHIVKVLITKKVHDTLVEEWLPGSEAQEIVRTFVHKTAADIFIPAGGRPATLNQATAADFFDAKERPTARAIIEGANLYITPEVRRLLEQKGALIIKDSSANKGGVICSSFEVLSSLALTESEFLQHKETIVEEILQKIEQYAREEVQLILETHASTGEFCCDISEMISERINSYSAEIRDFLQPIELKDGAYMSCFFEFCLPLFASQFRERLIQAIPDVHKKAIIAAWIASKVVYLRGLAWSPSIVDVLPFLVQDPHITSCILRREKRI